MSVILLELCDIENAEHVFFRCHLFQTQRIRIFRATKAFHPVNLQTVLFGRNSMSIDENVFIFKFQQFIKDTSRFSDGLPCKNTDNVVFNASKHSVKNRTVV